MGSIVWFASNLDTKVDGLESEVKGIKVQTVDLVKKSIQSEVRLDNIQKSVEGISANLQNVQNLISNKEAKNVDQLKLKDK